LTDHELLLQATELKALDRAGWKRVGITHPESVAAHSWGVAFAALVRCPAHLDRARVMAMALVHDLPEVRVGDLTPHDSVHPDEKHRREFDTAKALFTAHPELLSLWTEAAEQRTPEAKFLKELDRLDMGIQAEKYQSDGFDTSEFSRSSAEALATLIQGEKGSEPA
jgi:putative hydrolase of HD superfamily